ncbi:type IV secretory system conjugative DNA transfer family protein [Streptomyces sp. NPDC087440]|uniref:type IV secretory system conjugative DNA transfer family protein n=1 Tax=Streptomyces sp. NPDC087440 TaxID=3365790 RepID=UPI0038238440
MPGSYDRGRGHEQGRGGGGGPRREGTGGIPDGLLLGLLGLLLGLTVLTWTSTGLAGLFAHGSWPSRVTFPNTPAAMRQLATEPQNIPAAWPTTPAGELSGYGLFWGLFISQLLILLVLTIFTLGTLTRWRLTRTHSREPRPTTPAPGSPLGRRGRPPGAERAGKGAAPGGAEPPPPAHPGTPHPDTAPAEPPAPTTTAHLTSPRPAPEDVHLSAPPPPPRTPHWGLLLNRPTHHTTATEAILDAPGPTLVVTSTPTLWSDTKDARAKLGPVLLYDPEHHCDTPSRLHWSPTTGCEDPTTATARARALLAPVRPRAQADSAVADTAETLLSSWLHAAAIDDRPFKHLLRWAQGSGAHEPVRILRTHPRARSGAAGLLESALTAHPERREQAQHLTTRAFSALSSIHIREACTPNRTDSLTLESFVVEGGTLYMVGESIEDPRTRPTGPGAMPLLTALASHVVEHGRRMAARSTDGRLDPPMTLVLDDVAAVAPLPQLPELLTAGQGQGLPTLALLRSQEQFNSAWPQAR